ncbi:MAG: hypothetical protein RQ993_02825 [Bacteroidota bacterium]|nr:hypothetical protein [Bacteroidota bacterium]
MGPWYVAPIAIIGSFYCFTAKAQKLSPGLYISSRGFTYDPYYEKAILTTKDTLLPAKSAFLLSIVQAVGHRTYPDTLRNLHLLPPDEWPRGFFLVSLLLLYGGLFPMLYARSNKIITEEGHKLSASLTLRKVAFSDTVEKKVEFALPPTAWKEALIDSLTKYLQEL